MTASRYKEEWQGGQPNRCPACDAPWPLALARPYRKQTCETCKAEKKRRYEAAARAWQKRRIIEDQKHKARMAAMTPEERKAQLDKDWKDLFGP